MQVTLAILATLAGMTRWFRSGEAPWLIGALLIMAVIPFTILAILPTNRKLLEAGRDLRSEETRKLLEAWGRLHAVRSILSGVATIVYLYALVGHHPEGGFVDGLQIIRSLS
jgi:hypothetical protein